MRWFSFRNRKFLFAGVGLMAALLAGTVGLERARLLGWYYVHRLARAGGADREVWVARVAGLDRAALPSLLGLLEQEDARACGNAQAALARIAQGWQPDDPRWAELAGQLTDAFPRQSAAGRECLVQQLAEWLRLDPAAAPGALPSCAGRLLEQAGSATEGDVEGPLLDLADALLAVAGQAEQAAACRKLARKGLASAEPENRVRAVRLALHPGINLLPQVASLLSDPAPEVRRAALLAVGPVAGAITTDNLLPWLHDPDPDVRRLCEAALLAREDFKPEHLPLARLITASQPGVRLQVLSHLQRDATLELGVWLRRLSHDPAPEVRAAAIRAAASQRLVDLWDVIEQRAQGDPSPTVSQLARYYLSIQKRQ